jgi:hypothetical protein
MCCDAHSSPFGMARCPGRIHFDLVTGHVIEPSWGPTRTQEDALAHLEHLIASDPQAIKWHIVLDHLNIHQSESQVALGG